MFPHPSADRELATAGARRTKNRVPSRFDRHDLFSLFTSVVLVSSVIALVKQRSMKRSEPNLSFHT